MQVMNTFVWTARTKFLCYHKLKARCTTFDHSRDIGFPPRAFSFELNPIENSRRQGREGWKICVPSRRLKGEFPLSLSLRWPKVRLGGRGGPLPSISDPRNAESSLMCTSTTSLLPDKVGGWHFSGQSSSILKKSF